MAACEQTGRRSYSVEIDTLYCDVILERFEQLTGKSATLDGSGATFAEVKKERA